MAPTLQDVTVVIVTYNSAHCLGALGTALAGFENVSVVDNGSDDWWKLTDQMENSPT